MYEDTPDDIVHDLLSKAIYGDHSLGYPILGTEETLSTFNGDSLRKYMDEFYTPDRVVISVAGTSMTPSFVRSKHYLARMKERVKAACRSPAIPL